MSVRTYIGARYVPLFAEPLQWDATRTYEPLTVVLYQGNSYTSRQAVPANIDITNTTYWAQTGNYNAQVEQYRQEVQTFDGRITQNATDISTEETARADADTALQTAIDNEASARANADTALGTRITNESEARANADTGLQTAINNESEARASADLLINTRIDSLIPQSHLIIIGDSYSSAAHSSDHGITPWWVTYAERKNLTPHCYATSGVGYIVAPNWNSTFYDQAVAAHNDTTFEDSQVAEIIIYGGLNDILHGGNLDTLEGAVGNLCNYLNTMFPRARKTIVYGNTFATYPNSVGNVSFADLCYKTKNAAVTKGIEVFGDTGIYAFCPDMFTDGFGGHPGPAGHKQIASYILSGGKTLPKLVSAPFENLSTLNMSHLNAPNEYMIHGTWDAESAGISTAIYAHNMVFRLSGYVLKPVYTQVVDNVPMIQIYPRELAFRNQQQGNSQVGFTFKADF